MPGATALDVEAIGFAVVGRQTTTLGGVALGRVGGGARSADIDWLADFYGVFKPIRLSGALNHLTGLTFLGPCPGFGLLLDLKEAIVDKGEDLCQTKLKGRKEGKTLGQKERDQN
ncbi:hypothetical protein BY996DRAFT_6596893 [Phakopsora pachyrhizi]|nr:hypothetical protein BY996DRAFT_6596893 [Phakopsora pachyrhizi]